MYGRTVDDRVLEFGHEGVLYRNSFVMYDRATRSLWVHTTGQAVKGELRGSELEFLPSEVVPWRDWWERHPGTLVLDRGGEDEGFMGTFALPEQDEDFGLSVGSGTDATLYVHGHLVDEGLVQRGDQVVVHVEDEDLVRAFDAKGRNLQLDEEGRLDDGAGARWDPVTGEALEGTGEPLRRLPVTAWLVDRWRGFYADGEVVDGD